MSTDFVGAPSVSGDFVIRDVTAVNVADSSRSGGQDVRISAGTIAGITPTGVRDRAAVVAGNGAFVVPGFSDSHAHALNTPGQVGGAYALMLANGIVEFRQMSGNPKLLAGRLPTLLGAPVLDDHRLACRSAMVVVCRAAYTLGMASGERASVVTAGSRGSLDEESREWLRCLSVPAEREQSLARLHQLLLRAAHAELRRRNPLTAIQGQEKDDLANQAADDALLAISTKLDRFRGESRFTTWAYKFVMLEVSAKLGRHYWRHPPVSLGDEAWERIPDRLGADPAKHAESRELAAALRQAVTEVLSERQRQVFVALVVDGIPLDALADELGSTRNALYKMIFDARRKIRAHLVARGYLSDEGGMR